MERNRLAELASAPIPARKPSNSLADLIAGRSPLPSGQEQQFQAAMFFEPGWRDWYRDFTREAGGPPDLSPGGDYNYRLAYLSGARPEYYEPTGTYHGVSDAVVPPLRDPIPLKAGDHPTRWMAEFVDRFGVDPNDVRDEDVTPEMRDFVAARVVRPTDF